MDIHTNHNAGFFSCCSVKLHKIIEFININNKLPNVNSSKQFLWYKEPKKKNIDITYDYFEKYENININLNFQNINYDKSYQFTNYKDLDYININPIIKKYFSPSNEIKNIIKNIEIKYNIQPNNICVLFYRGNDKSTETKLCKYEEYLNYSNNILEKNPNIQFLIQSDETEFIEFMLNKYPNNSFFLKDEIRHMKKCNKTVDKTMKNKIFLFSKYYLAITIIMSKCKYIICGSGNCSIWIMLYRNNSNNVYQNLDRKWLIPLIN